MVAPKLRFTGFDGDWGEKKFSEQFNFHNTNSYSRALLAEQGEIMNIHYGDIHTKFSMLFDVKEEAVPFLSSEIDTNKIAENQFLQVGDLVIADASEDYKDIGKAIEVINLDNKKVVAGLHTYIARPVERCAIGFNGYLMQTFEVREQIKKLATGISVLGISKTNLGKVELKIPCLAEQTKIASFLSAVDEKISQLTQKHQLLSQYKQGMMQKLFSQEIRFKADDGSEFGEWEETELGKHCQIKTGKLDANAMRPNGEFRFYTCAKEFYLIDEYAFDTEALLISGNGANVGYIHYYKGKFNAYQRTYVLDQWQQNIIFIQYFLEQFLKERIYGEKKEGNTPYIVLSTLSEMPLLLPCLEEQTKIANFLSAIDQKIEVVAQQIEQAKTWKKGLLQQMFI